MWWRKAHEEPTHRLVHFGPEHEAKNVGFCSNKITTSLYTWWNGPFKLPWEEFSRASNFYFVIISALQVWPVTSNTGSVPTSLPALLLVVAVSIILKIQEDRLRHRSDRKANNAPCLRMHGTAFVESVWTDVQVGDVLKICNRDSIPADVVLLAAHEPDPNVVRGACHVETMQLDGETNLKGKSVPSVFTNVLGAGLDAQLAKYKGLVGHIEAEAPNASTNTFNGMVHLDGCSPAPLSIANVLLRGSTLRNTEYVLGLVVNTGKDTKVMQGARRPPTKESSIFHSIQFMMVAIVVLLIILCLAAAAGTESAYSAIGLDSHWYLEDGSSMNFFLNTLYFFTLLSSFVSVTLNASIALVQKLIAQFMQWSLSMYDEESDMPATVRTASLVDELGIITHVFSDKTGTLTQNVMQFRKVSINGVSYGRGTTEIGLARLRRLGVTPEDELDQLENGLVAKRGSGKELVNFDDPSLEEILRDGGGSHEQQECCRKFFLHLALCHTVVTEVYEGKTSLSASSPDEAALVSAAQYFGFEFVDRHHDSVKVRDKWRGDRLLHFDVLDVLEFTSARRRMSVIVRDRETGAIVLLSKGADSVMIPLLAPGQEKLKALTEQHMTDHSNDGLRTLVIASKSLEEEAYLAWSREYRRATSDIVELERNAREEPNMIDRLSEELETQLKLLGSTALEDKLQVGVPTSIADLVRAGIAVWMLTGDKEETAINIAFACQLLDSQTDLLVISRRTHATLEEMTADLRKGCDHHPEHREARKGLVVDGDALELLLKQRPEYSTAQLAFLKYTQQCAAVVACRCAPSQKAELVKLIRRNVRGAATLAIGDGANDVAMIQAAHVGVGISGQEGMQAVNAADFAIAQFRFLRELLIVHGRNNYRRLSVLVYYIFYKNIMMVLTVYWFNAYNAFSGSKWNLEVGYQLYNALFTLFPIIWIGFTDKDLADENSRMLPQTYHLGIRRHYFNAWAAARWVAQGVYESIAISFVCIYALQKMSVNGEDPDVYLIGAATFSLAVVIVSHPAIAPDVAQAHTPPTQE